MESLCLLNILLQSNVSFIYPMCSENTDFLVIFATLVTNSVSLSLSLNIRWGGNLLSVPQDRVQ